MAKKKDAASKRVKVHIAPDLAERLAASGEDLDARVDAVLRAHLEPKPQGKFAELISEFGPQVEQAARTVATKVARDVATAALNAWSDKMTQAKTDPAASDASQRKPPPKR